MTINPTNNKPPYEYEDVTGILIEGMDDFIGIRKGSLKDDVVTILGVEHLTITAIDHFDGAKIFMFATKIAAIKYEPENLSAVEDGVSRIPRPLP